MDRSSGILALCLSGLLLAGSVTLLSIDAQTQQTQSQPVRKNPIPDTFTNLKVLPPDIQKADLVAIMKAMSVGLKVRCSSCHQATDDLSEADFASDEKPTKIAAREMLRTLFDTRAKYPVAKSSTSSNTSK